MPWNHKWERVDITTKISKDSVLRKGRLGRQFKIRAVNNHSGGYAFDQKDRLATAMNRGFAVFNHVFVRPWVDYTTDVPYQTWCINDKDIRSENYWIKK